MTDMIRIDFYKYGCLKCVSAKIVNHYGNLKKKEI